MKTRNTNKGNIKHVTGIAIGILAAVVILFSQSFYFEYVANIEGKATVEHSSDVDSSETVLKMAHQALSTVVQFAIHNVLHFISQIYIENNTELEVKIENSISFDSFFQTLFRLIISPNAP